MSAEGTLVEIAANNIEKGIHGEDGILEVVPASGTRDLFVVARDERCILS